MSDSPMNSLRAEQQLITQLLEVLKQEQDHLVAADIDKLTALTPHKSDLVAQMAALATGRHKALAALGFAAQEAGMEAWLAAQGDDESRALWQQVLDQTREAKELNRLNGMLINKHLSTTQGALQALRPQAAAAAVYGPTGHTTSVSRSRGFIAG
ncbi:MAG TPA: flagellar protein FlgN [Pseudoduganella sp.]